MAGSTLDLEVIIEPDHLASEIGNKYSEWSMLRASKIEQWKELRNYLYATDTSTTSNAILPWSNNTTTPKLTQIMDNLHANYFASLFPSRDWMRWEGDSSDDNSKLVATRVQNYLNHKISKSGFVDTVSDLLNDYIQYGNCFGMVSHETEWSEAADGSRNVKYRGPKLSRISPYDIVFNPVATSFDKTPKIVRSVVTLGEIQKLIEEDPRNESLGQIFSKMLHNRECVTAADAVEKAEGFTADGFSNIQHYYGSNYVELLTFYGDIYDSSTNKLLKNREIVIVDRAYVIENKTGESWFGTAPIFHAGWRNRPDNLYAMGPLDNLVGLQYRIDHLENIKADVFDQIAYPVLKIKGDVEDFDWEPGAQIFIGEEGDVGYLMPDTTALQADLQIDVLQNRMEELAGAPKQAMGIRTPGEKTAFEVQSLQNSASRIFEHKTAHFERVFLEPILNSMLEVGRRYMDTIETVRAVNEDKGNTYFIEVSKEDIMAEGKLVPIGARHFAEKARKVQNLSNLHQMILSDPQLGVHISRKIMAKTIAEELGELDMYKENVGVEEQLETQQSMQDAEVQNEEDLQDAAERGI